MRKPELPDVVTLAEDIGGRMLDSPITLYILIALILFCMGVVIGEEIIRGITG